ncbi:Pycsar system effector family protein [Sorangium sp. So ce693]|uniref:Pycsar system effector family protein n=1 Tax=Sorangium sp. So ce693 TaxID=3133318 RepID=UPI003F61F24C
MADVEPPTQPVESKGKDDIEFLLKVIGRYDTYIGTTNTKAAGLVALCAFLVGSALSKWNDLVSGPRPLQWAIGICLFFATLAALASIFRAMEAIFPQTRSPERPQEYSSLIAYSAVAKHSADSYHKSILGQVESARVLDCAFQVHTLAVIATDKFAKLQKSFWWLLWLVIPLTGLAVVLRFLSEVFAALMR